MTLSEAERRDLRLKLMQGETHGQDHYLVRIDTQIPNSQDALFPGGSTYGYIQSWNAANLDWEDSGIPVLVNDWVLDQAGNFDCGRTFAIHNERIRCMTIGRKVYTVGAEQGLYRMFQADADITAGSFGLATVIDTSVQLQVHNALGCRDILENEKFYARYFPERCRWEVVELCAQEQSWIPDVLTTLSQDLCPSDTTASVVSPGENLLTGNNVTISADPQNIFGLAGKSGDYVLLKWRESISKYIVAQVEHHAYEQILADEQDPDGLIWYENCKIKGNVAEVALMTCEDPVEEDLITLQQRSLVKNVYLQAAVDQSGEGNIQCPKIFKELTDVCLFDEDDLKAPVAVISFEMVDVLTDHGDDGECFQLYAQAICVAAYDQDGVWEDAICGVDCVTGSGSGSQ